MNTLKLTWLCKPFHDLTPQELYAILRLRSEVFVVEQNCVFLDMDNKDQVAYHLMGYSNDELIATTRLLGKDTAYKLMSIGRVVTSPRHRGTGAGRALMEESIKRCYELFGTEDIKIGAQLYLRKFYESFGFQQSSDMYLEDDIEHIEMIKQVDH